MAEELKREFNAEVTLEKSSGGAFEVSVNGLLVFSKLQMDRFPEAGEIQQIIRKKCI